MIKIEHVVLASPEQMEFIIEGMRNSINSLAKSDSYTNEVFETKVWSNGQGCSKKLTGFKHVLGDNDHSLMQRLANAGTDYRKFMRMMPVYVRITAPLYW